MTNREKQAAEIIVFAFKNNTLLYTRGMGRLNLI